MKAIARMLTVIPKVTEKISHPKPVMQLVANETQPSVTKPTTASNKNPSLDNEYDDKAGQEYNVLQPH